MDEHAPFPINRFSDGYGPLVNYATGLYRLIYRFGASRQRVRFTEQAVYPFVRRRVADALLAPQADIFLSVHPLQTDVPLQVLRELGHAAPFLAVVTDPVTPPVAWFCPHMDLCVVATESARQMALACGLPSERVPVIGLPVRRAFVRVAGQPKFEARQRLGVTPELPLVLLSGGGAGIGRLLPMARAIAWELALDGVPAQLAIIAGRNEMLQSRLRGQSWPLPVTVLGFVDNMPEWLAASDLLLTKAGPGTMAEAACVGVPMIVTDFVPGQEEGNLAWLKEAGAGVFEHRPERVGALVGDWLRPGNPTLARMAAGTRAMAHCDAAERIVEATLQVYRRTAT
jgi:1,2-diacylglycerol 3-beta-galactosyltransferase